MRLAGHTYPFRTLPLADALDAVQRLGLRDVELWLGHAPDADEAAARVRERGLRVAAVSSGGVYEPGADVAVRAFALAAMLGAPVVAGSLAPAAASWLEERLPDGVAFAVENHWDQPLDTSRAVLAVLAGHARLTACLDTGHALLAGERPERAVHALGSRLAHVHLKDARLSRAHERMLGRRLRRRLLDRPEPSRVGTGALDVAALKAALAAVGYEGAVSAEYEGDDPEAELARLVAAWRGAG